MESSILTSTKKILGLSSEYTAFDTDVITHINATFSVLNQLGVGPVTGFFIEDETTEWEEYSTDVILLNLVRSYMFLKVRMLFDPPTTSFLLDSMTKQIDEFEWRLRSHTEWVADPNDPMA